MLQPKSSASASSSFIQIAARRLFHRCLPRARVLKTVNVPTSLLQTCTIAAQYSSSTPLPPLNRRRARLCIIPTSRAANPTAPSPRRAFLCGHCRVGDDPDATVDPDAVRTRTALGIDYDVDWAPTVALSGAASPYTSLRSSRFIQYQYLENETIALSPESATTTTLAPPQSPSGPTLSSSMGEGWIR
ncbi:hypothetical protein B0H11DRAFT_2233908 [Mycena galericulata]|nr:hypothetical protein B0H11DRAFT_2233908 [Mycena galericulata]